MYFKQQPLSLIFHFQSQHSHDHSHHTDHERNEIRGEADPLSPTSNSPKKVGINFSDSPTVIGGSAFDNPAAHFDLENEGNGVVTKVSFVFNLYEEATLKIKVVLTGI